MGVLRFRAFPYLFAVMIFHIENCCVFIGLIVATRAAGMLPSFFCPYGANYPTDEELPIF